VRKNAKFKSGIRTGMGIVCSNKALPAARLAAGANSVLQSGSGVVVVGEPAEQKIV
jgi:hypothetical protein